MRTLRSRKWVGDFLGIKLYRIPNLPLVPIRIGYSTIVYDEAEVRRFKEQLESGHFKGVLDTPREG